MEKAIYDVVIIGSGPSGLTAAIYTSRANLKTLVIAGEKWGGQLMLTSEVENFPGFHDGIMGPALMENMRAQAEKFGAEIVMNNANKISKGDQSLFEVKAGDHLYVCKSVILAMGADTKWLGVEGESDYIGRGISSCAPCDAAFFRNKRVYVVGGGDSALEEALVLTKFADDVTLVHRRDSFRASKIMVDRIMNHPKIKVFWNTEIVKVTGDSVLRSVLLTSEKRYFEGDKDFILGRGNGKVVEKKENDDLGVEWESMIDGVFVAIGHTPNSNLVKDLVNVDEKGYILRESEIDGKGNLYKTMTSIKGVFVSGDIHDHVYKQAVTAAASGCEAAMDCEKWLEDMQNA